jgi:hypothetical protein
MFIFTKCQGISVPKFTAKERTEVKNMVASLTIKRIPDPIIIKHAENTTGKITQIRNDIDNN